MRCSGPDPLTVCGAGTVAGGQQQQDSGHGEAGGKVQLRDLYMVQGWFGLQLTLYLGESGVHSSGGLEAEAGWQLRFGGDLSSGDNWELGQVEDYLVQQGELLLGGRQPTAGTSGYCWTCAAG